MKQKNLYSYNIIIDSFTFIDNYLKLNVKNNKNKYLINIKDGSVDADIKNSEKKMVGIKYLEEGDLVKVKGIKIDDKIIIKKIYVETKYSFDSESSEDLDIY